jgi:hypothetical protein
MITSPTRKGSLCAPSTVCVGPPGSRPDSMTFSFSAPVGIGFELEEIGPGAGPYSIQFIDPPWSAPKHRRRFVSPPQSSGTNPLSWSCCRTFIRIGDWDDRSYSPRNREMGPCAARAWLKRLEPFGGIDAVIGSDHQHDQVVTLGSYAHAWK